LVQHGKQIVRLAIGLVDHGRITETATVERDDPIVGGEGVKLVAPHAAIRNIRMQEDDGAALAGVLRRDPGVTDGDDG